MSSMELEGYERSGNMRSTTEKQATLSLLPILATIEPGIISSKLKRSWSKSSTKLTRTRMVRSMDKKPVRIGLWEAGVSCAKNLHQNTAITGLTRLKTGWRILFLIPETFKLPPPDR